MFRSQVELVFHFCTFCTGIWGSAFTVLLQKMLRDNQHPNEVAKNHGIKGDGRKELGTSRSIFVNYSSQPLMFCRFFLFENEMRCLLLIENELDTTCVNMTTFL